MENRKRIVSVIAPLAPCSQLAGLLEALNNLDFQGRIVPMPVNKIDDVDPQHRRILFVASSDSLSRLLAQLPGWTVSPQLAVFASGVPWGREILNFCPDVMFWPCSQNELLFRLEHVFSSVDYQEVKVFSKLALQLNLIGQAPAFLRALSVVQRIAKHRATVLISGETGTGKELVARAIHYLGSYSNGPFVPVNCGGIPEDLFENELFGHTQGAYTGAKGKQCGYVERANGGTLFLDEIDSLSLNAQATLLRLLQDQFYKPLGSEKPKRANARIIAATNTNLRARVDAQQFRQDLLFRLNVLAVELPALRDRPGDAAILAAHFVKKFSRENGKAIRPLHPRFLSWIEEHSWPGNIRELENTILRAFLLSEGRFVCLDNHDDDEPDGTMTLGKFSEQKARAIIGFEHQYLERLLIQAHGNVSLAAKLSGKERRALGKLLQKHGINRLDYVHHTDQFSH